ncbi:MAG: ATP-binding protein [Candidatus Aminicenantes bacterium]|nr:ATP-binding protein [Candidatus Aminicenantes bacterium]
MKEKNEPYRQDVAFIDRDKELADLRLFVDKRPSEILFIHGPKSSGKTTLLYKFLGQIQKEQRLDVKFMDLRETFTNVYDDFLKTFFRIEIQGEKKESRASNINIGFFKIDASVEKKILEKRADPFKVMKAEFLELTRQGIKPILIIDELQALDKIYLENDKERQLITALFNFFVAMTKQAHLAHIIIASSDGYFLNTVYNDSKLKKCSRYYKVDYLAKKDVMEWLLNLEKYSKIKAYRLTEEDAEKIWDTVGGSMWEIQDILTELFENPIDEVLHLYKKKIKGMIEYNIGADMEKEKVLHVFLKQETARLRDFISQGIAPAEIDPLLQNLVRNNILYFDPTEAVYYPQGKSYQWGIKLYFESIEQYK